MQAWGFLPTSLPVTRAAREPGLWPEEGARRRALLLLLFPLPGELKGGRAWVGRLEPGPCGPRGSRAGRATQSRADFNMMAAEAGSEEGGPVTAGAAGGGAAAGSSAYPAVCRVKIPAALPVAAVSYSGLAEAGVAGTLGGGAALGSGFLGTGSVAGALGGAGLSGGGAAAGVAGAAVAGPGGEMALTRGTTSSPAETFGAGGGFPPLPPPPPQLPPLGGGLGTVDEGDSLDGPEYEEEEVAIPLTAPPTNQ